MSNNIACARFGQPKFSRDSIAEFEYVTSRFDATQGRSLGVQVNAITSGGTNKYAGTVSGYFRSDQFNAEDFIVHRVLDYSNQQFSTTFGGPIIRDRAHIFFNYEGEREPQTYTFNSQFPRFNIGDLTGVRKEHKAGARADFQLSSTSRLMARVNGWDFNQPYTPASAGGSTRRGHASSFTGQLQGGADRPGVRLADPDLRQHGQRPEGRSLDGVLGTTKAWSSHRRSACSATPSARRTSSR